MPRGERFSIERITVGESADALSIEEFLNAVAQYGFVRILPPPGVIDRPVADASPRVIAKGRRCAAAVYDLRSVEVAAIGFAAGGVKAALPVSVSLRIL